MIEKESLKKYLLQFGYGRWNKIRKYSQQTCKILKDKPDIEMKAFANDFLRTLYDQLINEKNEKNELRGFIMNTIEELPEDPYVQSNTKDWGEQIGQRAAPWTKRMQLLQRVKGLVKAYKSEKMKYLAKPESERDSQVAK